VLLLALSYCLFVFHSIGDWWTDLNFDKLMMEAGTRWFRPNEIYAVLANHARFKVHAQPIDKPISMCSAFSINPWLYCTLHMCLFSFCNLYMAYLNKRKQNRSLCVEVPSIKRLCSLSFWVWTIWFVCRMNSSNYPSVQGQLLYCLECYDWSSAGIHKRRDEWMNAHLIFEYEGDLLD